MAKRKKATGFPVIVLDPDGAHKVLAYDARSKGEALKFARMHGYDLRGGSPVDIGASARTGHAKAWHVYVPKIHVTAKAGPAVRRAVKPAREVTRIRENAPSAVKKPAKAPKPAKVKKPKAPKKPKGKRSGKAKR